jgi:hypothetical protein
MKTALTALKFLLLFAALSASAYVLYEPVTEYLTPPCTKPIEYSIGTYDKRFGVSESQFKLALIHAASVWNTEAGKTLITLADADSKEVMPVSLVYSEVQKATELGKNISAEQAEYDAKKAEVNRIRDSFSATKEAYERKTTAYERAVKSYEKDVAYWNERGGAPPDEYAKLKAKADALERDRRALNAEADEVNAFAGKINTAVAELNGIAKKINAKVGTYNKQAGEDFEQGHYVSDADGERIEIYEMKNVADLERVLTHEFGHALGLGHVENPDSIMYSFNIGEGLELSEEDKAELRSVCKLEK